MKFLFSVFFVIVIVSFLAATIINVPADQPTIQEGIDVAVDGDTVLVHPGTYYENINYNGKLITIASLFLTTQDTTYISQTIIDGNQDGSVVTFESGEDSTAVLIGFTITNGNSGWGYGGGGIICYYSNPKILNNHIINNVGNRGGGIFCYNANPLIMENLISNNYAFGIGETNYGGGIGCSESNPIIKNTLILNNSVSWGYGGGIYCNNSDPSLDNVTISGNSATYGGGISCENSSPSLENVIITGNTAAYHGGGIWCWSSSPSLTNVIISGNTAGSGGGISCRNNSSPILQNVTIAANSASYNGGGIYCNGSSNPILVNCILWNDSPQEIYFNPDDDPNSVTISYSDIQGGLAGIETNNNGTVNWQEGNIDEDPLFIGTGEHPYSLLEDSPCIDAGIPDTTGLNLPLWDIIGNLRIWDGDGDEVAIIDMGAYEYGAPPYVDIDDNVIV